MKKLLLALGLSTAITAFPTMAQEAAWDANADGELSVEEFSTGFADTGLYSEWDADGSGSLEVSELREGFYNIHDDNGDGIISEEEWDDGVFETDFQEWDENGDAQLDQEEFTNVFEGTVGDWDAEGDGNLTENEFSEGVFDTYNLDDDEVLTADEFGSLPGDLGEEGWFDF